MYIKAVEINKREEIKMSNIRLSLDSGRKNLEIEELDIEKILDDTEEEMQNVNVKYLTHEEVFSKARRIIDIERYI